MERKELEQLINQNQEEISKINKENFLDYAWDSILDSYKIICENEMIDGEQVDTFHTTVAMEECAELSQAISKVFRDKLIIYRQLRNPSEEELSKKFEDQDEHDFNLNEEIADVIMNIIRLNLVLGDKVKPEKVFSILGAKLIRYRKYAERCREEGRLI